MSNLLSKASFFFSTALYFAIWAFIILAALGYSALPLCALLSLCTHIRMPPPLGQPPPVMDIFVVFAIVYAFPFGVLILVLSIFYQSYYWLIPASLLLLRAICNLSIKPSLTSAFTALPNFPKNYLSTTSLHRLPCLARLHPFLLYFCTPTLDGGVTIEEVSVGATSCDVYRAAGIAAPQPLFFFLHGGGWKGGAKRIHAQAALLHNLAVKGWIVVSADYRKSWPNHVTDAIGGLEFFRNHASEYNIDVKRVVLGGASAGGHLTTLLTQYALQHDIPILRQVLIYPCIDVEDECFSCAVSPLTVPCMRLSCGQSLLSWFFFIVVLRGDASLWQDANPMNFIYKLKPEQAASYPATMIIHGNNDSIASLENSQYYLSSLCAMAHDAPRRGWCSDKYRECDVLVTVPGMRHSFEICNCSIVDTVFLGVMGWLDIVREPRDCTNRDHGSDSVLASDVAVKVD